MRFDPILARELTPEQRELLLAIRREHPHLSVPTISITLVAERRLEPVRFQPRRCAVFRLSKSWIAWHCAPAGPDKVRLRWQALHSGALWHADVCHPRSVRIGSPHCEARHLLSHSPFCASRCSRASGPHATQSEACSRSSRARSWPSGSLIGSLEREGIRGRPRSSKDGSRAPRPFLSSTGARRTAIEIDEELGDARVELAPSNTTPGRCEQTLAGSCRSTMRAATARPSGCTGANRASS